MGTELTQGGNIRLPDTPEIRLDIRWDPERPGGQEVDASAFLLGPGGEVGGDADFIFYGQLRSPCGGVTLIEQPGAYRQFHVVLGALPERVAKVAVCLTLYGGVAFGQARTVDLRVRDGAGRELAAFRPQTAGMQEAALIFGEVYRRQGQWKLRAVAQGFAGGLGPLARHFGVEVASDAEVDTAQGTVASPPPSAPGSPPPPPPAPPSAGSAPPPPPAAPPLEKAPAVGAMPGGSGPERSAAAGLQYELLHRGTYAMARVYLPGGRQLKAQSDAMLAMSPTIEVAGQMQGGLLGGLGRLVGGESLFLQTLTAARGDGTVYLAPTAPGDVAALEVLPGQGWTIAHSSFLACSDGVEVGTRMQNLAQGLFGGAGLFVTKAEGRGLVLLEAFGAIHKLTLAAGEERIVDNGHLVAWSESVYYDLQLGNRGLVAAFTSGENIVCRFRGPGTVLLQSRQPLGFGRWVSALLPSR